MEKRLIIVIAHGKENTEEIEKKLSNNNYIIVRDLCDKEKKNEICIRKYLGKGESVKLGLKYALNKNYDKVLILDRDAPISRKNLNEVFELLDKYDIIYGIRLYKKRSIIRKFLSKMYILFVKFLFPELYSIKDFQCGFKALSKKYLKFVTKKLKVGGFSYDVNLIYYSRFFKIRGYKIIWMENESTFSKKLLKNMFKMFLELVYFRFRSLS